MARKFFSVDQEIDLTTEEIEEILAQIAEVLRKHYEGILDEPIPDDIVKILEKLDIDVSTTLLN